ncbi:pentatricopeptide repeat-containing protein At1g10270-like [Mangifera indica]|uniref:pentatricopeptide repeat-containing protein At1g10270-like n=1 Tax=Mangifera indica TaxID=29780 RepID=UPI001CFA7C7E|nr:pentatricopeptide repeat-containing protein At1g10270-like [Mangifera indica]
MPLHGLLLRSLYRHNNRLSSLYPAVLHRHHFHNLTNDPPTPLINPNPNPDPSPISAPLTRTYGFSSAEEAAAERRRRKRRLRIEPPLHAIRPNPTHPPARDPNAPRLPDSTSALVGPRLSLHNRVQSLIRAGDLDAASYLVRQAVFSNTRPTVFTCNAIIAAMYRAKRYNDAVALFAFFFEQSDIVPNVVSYNNLINTHCDEGRVDEGLKVYRKIIETAPFSPSAVTYRHLTKGLIDLGRIGEAVDLLREMLNKGQGADSLVYNNLIGGFLNLGNLEKANELFDELRERCLVYDGVVNATYMEWWFKQGKEKEAMESYKSLLDRKFRMTPATCNTLLEVLLKWGKKVEAQILFEQMLDNHQPPNIQAVNSDTFNIMVNECFKIGNFSEAIDTFKKAGTHPKSKPFSMDVAGYNNIIARFCENGMLEEAEKLFAELCSKTLTPNVPSFKTLIDAYLKVERVDDALQLFSRMVETGLRVVVSFGTRVFSEFIDKGKAAECAPILTKMGEQDPKPDFLIYDVVVRGLCNEGLFHLSRDIVDQMIRHNIGVTPALQEFLRVTFGNVGQGEEIERILTMNRWGFAASHPPPRITGPPRVRGQQPFVPHQMAEQPLGPNQMSRQQPFGVSNRMAGQQHFGSNHMAGQQSFGPNQMAGQQPFVGNQSMGQNPLGPNQISGRQPEGPNQVWGQQPLGSNQMAGQEPFGFHQATSQQQNGMPQMAGQSPSGPQQMAGQQQSWQHQISSQQPSWSQVTHRPPFGSPLEADQSPTGHSQMAGQQQSWQPQISGQRFPFSQVTQQPPFGFPQGEQNTSGPLKWLVNSNPGNHKYQGSSHHGLELQSGHLLDPLKKQNKIHLDPMNGRRTTNR